MKKSPLIKQLELDLLEHKRKTSSLPEYAIVKPKLNENSANALTKCILAFINLQEACMAWRVNNTGIYDAKLGRHRKSNTRKGIADISAIREGRTWQIEVKYGRDKLSEHQKKFGAEVEQAGGVFCTAYTFEQFINRWNETAND